MKSSVISFLYRLVWHVVRRQPGVIGITFMGIFSSLVEVVAMASLIPISLLAAHQDISATSPWRKIAIIVGQTPNVRFFLASFLGLLVVRLVVGTVTMSLISRTYRGLIAHFSSSALDGFVHHLRFEDVQKESIGHFITLAGDEANRAAQIIMAAMKIMPIIALMAFYLAILFYQSPLIGLGLLAFFALTLAFLRHAFRISHQLGQRQQEQSRALGTHFLESLNGLRTVRGFNGEFYISSRYREMLVSYAKVCLSVDNVNLLSRALPAILLLLAAFVAMENLAGGDWLVAHLSLVFVGTMMILRLLPLAGQALDLGLRLTSDLRAAENIGKMLDAVEEHDGAEPGMSPLEGQQIESIEFIDVTFRYGESAPIVLNCFSQKFEAGRSYALIGPSGVGKSSLIDLLLKFYDPSDGTIYVNGVNNAQIPSNWMREHIILAEQTTRLFYDTVLSNILFGRNAKPEEAATALQTVGLQDFIATLPDGADTMVMYQGSNFSGGQKQRVGLARALLKSTDVLVIDEGTSALDRATRSIVMDGILAAYREKIVIFITHDPEVVERVDEVVDMGALRMSAANNAEENV